YRDSVTVTLYKSMEASLMTPDEKAIPKPDVLKKEIVYDGEGYTRQSIEQMLGDYQRKHTVDLEKFGDLSKAYDRLSQEMTGDVSDQKSGIEYLSNIATFDEVGTNIKGLLHKIPIIRDLAPSRDLKELLSEKIEVAQRRVQEIGNYLDTL